MGDTVGGDHRSGPLRILRVYPGGNDPRQRQRELALIRRGHEVGLVLPDAYGSDWQVAPVEPTIATWRSRLWSHRSTPFHVWGAWVVAGATGELGPDGAEILADASRAACRGGGWVG